MHFTTSAADALSAGDAPSLFFGFAATLSDHHAIRLLDSILSGFAFRVKRRAKILPCQPHVDRFPA